MARVILGMTTSLDGFVADQHGRAAGPVNARETVRFCIYCSDPALLTEVSPTGLVFGYGS